MLWMMAWVWAGEPYLVDAYTEGAAAADLDGDGRLDLIEGSYLGPLVRWNEGGGYSDREIWGLLDSVGVAGGLRVQVGDVNGDGHVDVCSRVEESHRVVCAWGTGSRLAGEAVGLGVTAGSFDLVDFDGDGDLDLLRGNEQEVAVDLNDGFGTFTTAGTADIEHAQVLAGDLEGDGSLEVYARDIDGLHALSLQGGALVAVAGPADVVCHWWSEGLMVRDLDGDGDDDALLCETPDLAWVEADQGVLLDSRPFASLPAGGQGDLDGDGRADIVDLRGVTTLLGGPRGTLLSNSLGWEVPAFGLAWDSDGDGDDEFTVAVRGRRFFGANEGGVVDWRRVSHGPRDLLNLFVTDTDGDGFDDIVWLTEQGIWRQMSLGDGTFSLPAVVSAEVQHEDRNLLFDMDGDGVDDLIYARSPLFARRGTGDGFGPASELMTGVDTLSVTDLDGDGQRDDLLVGTDNDELFHVDEFGTARRLFDFAPAWWVHAAALDLDGDGLRDLVLTHNDGLWVARGLVGGGFGAPSLELPIDWSTGTDRRRVFAVDADGDGAIDDVLAAGPKDWDDYSDSRIVTATWNGTTLQPVASSVEANVLLDEIDGRLLVGVDHALHELDASTLELGPPLFEGPQRERSFIFEGTFTNYQLRAVAGGDVNGDGQPDLVVGGASEIWVLLGE